MAEGRVLAFPYRSRQAVWPLLRRPDGWGPVPDIAPLARVAAGLRRDKVTSFIEAVLVDWNHESEEEPSLHIALDLPADKAQAFGFITGPEKIQAMAEASRATQRCIDDVIGDFKHARLDEKNLQLLRDARGSIRQFRSLAKQFDKRIASKITQARATWRWPGPSVAGTLLDGAAPDLVECLAIQAHKRSSLLLEYAQHEAWQQAFDQYGRRM